MGKIIGLTGPSGAGKGTICAIFARFGIPSIDTDAVYHTLLAGDNDCTRALIDAFGESVRAHPCGIDRAALRRAVFTGDIPAHLHTLNAVTHKYIMAQTMQTVHAHLDSGAAAVIIDAPQLFEAGADRLCDIVLGVLAARDTRRARIIARDGLDTNTADRRLDAAHDDAYFRAHCDEVIENNGNLADLTASVCRFLEKNGVNFA